MMDADRAILSVALPGGMDLLRDQLRCAALPTNQLLSVLLDRLLLLGDIPRHAMDCSRGLLLDLIKVTSPPTSAHFPLLPVSYHTVPA